MLETLDPNTVYKVVGTLFLAFGFLLLMAAVVIHHKQKEIAALKQSYDLLYEQHLALIHKNIDAVSKSVR